MSLHNAAGAVMAVFAVSEVVLSIRKRAAGGTSEARDRTLKVIWLVVGASLAVAGLVSGFPVAKIDVSEETLAWTSMVITLGGMAFRWYAVATLGRFFTVDVAVLEGHEVIMAGPYRFIRHPSYLGLLVCFLGVGIYSGSWLSIVVAMVPITGVVLWRICSEEEVLRRGLGEAYCVYCEKTKRLIPWVY